MSVDQSKLKSKLQKGDEIIVITGKDKGKKGNVENVDLKRGRIKVPGINMVKKHRRATQERQAGEVVDIAAAISLSNVMIFCPSCKTGVRIKVDREGGNKERKCHKCGHVFKSTKS